MKEWEMIAMIVDRMCLLLYTVLSVVITTVLLTKHLVYDNSNYIAEIDSRKT